MSRIGNRILTIPAGVEVTIAGNKITTKGPKGTLEFNFKNDSGILNYLNSKSFTLENEIKWSNQKTIMFQLQ